MVKLLGKDYSKEDFRRYCVNISQVAGITETVYQDGRARGMRALRVRQRQRARLHPSPGPVHGYCAAFFQRRQYRPTDAQRTVRSPANGASPG